MAGAAGGGPPIGTTCPVCASRVGDPFLFRSGVPVHQHLLHPDPASAVAAARGDLEMVACGGCGFVFNRAFEPALMRYGAAYDNDQRHSPIFRDHVEQMAAIVAAGGRLAGARVLEVGCGDGSFLRRLVALGDAATTGVGFDPSYRGPATAAAGRVEFKTSYYSSDAGIRADLAVLRHAIEHVPDPVVLLAGAAAAVRDSASGAVFLETPDVGWILDNLVFWDFFYEHCSLFTEGSLVAAAARAGLGACAPGTVFGGQYLWLECRAGSGAAGAPGAVLGKAHAYAKAERRLLSAWGGRLAALAGRGPVAVWGAGAKGVTFVNLVDPGRQAIDCLADVNPGKQSHYVPGTGHPIVAPAALAARGVKSVLVLNPNYAGEIEAQARSAGLDVKVIAGEPAI